jgi:erythromycin esterase
MTHRPTIDRLRTIPLATLDPDATLDDLEPLRDLVGDARVVGLGESAHYVGEYALLQHRMLRFLVERMGFTVVAFESGFSEGLAVDRWIHGGDGDPDGVARRGLTYRLGQSPERRRLLAWMRGITATGGALTYAGLDLPADLASMRPALDSLDRYLADIDPDGRRLLGRIGELTAAYEGPHTMAAFAAYRAMDSSDRDELTLLLAELATRFDTLRPRYVRDSPAADHETARHELRLAGQLDQMLRAQVAAADGSAAHAAVNVRDAAMAGTVRWLLGRAPGRVAIVAGNTHLQRIPILLGGRVEVPVLGAHLATALGDDYVAVGVTCGGGRTPSRRAAPSTPAGAEVITVDLAAPADGSVEALLGLAGAGPRLADLRPLRAAGPTDAPRSMRLLESHLDLPVAEAFDLLAGVPTITPSADFLS